MPAKPAHGIQTDLFPLFPLIEFRPKEDEDDFSDRRELTGCSKKRIVRFWSAIPPYKFFLIMGLMDGLGSILGLIAYVSVFRRFQVAEDPELGRERRIRSAR